MTKELQSALQASTAISAPAPTDTRPPSSKNPVLSPPPGWQFRSGEPITPDGARKIIESRVIDDSKIYKPASQTSFASNTVSGAASIVEQARALKNDPQLIFEFVYNNIEWEPGFGVQKGALGCLLDGMGNSFDQTMLLVALLRQAGFTAKYVLGTIQLSEADYNAWFGTDSIWAAYNYCGNENIPAQSPTWTGSIYQMVMSHMWAQVVISGTTYVLDPSRKTYTRKSKLSTLGTALGYNAATFLSNAKSGATVDPSGNFVQNMNSANIRSGLSTMTTNLLNWIKTNDPDATIDDILGGQSIVPITLPFTWLTALPYQTPGDTPTIWATDIPNTYKTTLQVQFPLSTGGWSIDQTFTSDQLAGSRLTLFFNSSLQPELRLNGTLIATGEAQTAGTWNSVLLTVTHNGYPVTWYNQQWWQSFIWAGQYHLIGNAWGNLGRGQEFFHAKQLAANKAAGGATTAEPIMGEQLAQIWYSWAGQASRVTDLVNRITNCHSMFNHQVGIVSFNGGGSGAYATDIGGVSGSSTNLNNDVTQTPINDTVNAMHGVALEAAVLAQTTGLTPGISTTSVIDKANSSGNKIYKGTSGNWNTGANISAALVANGYSATDMANIYNWYLQYGYTAVLGDQPSLTLGAWTGWADWLFPSSGAFGLINGSYKGGGGQPGPAQNDISNDPSSPVSAPLSQPKAGDPIAMTTGDFLYTHDDISTGSQGFPYKLSFQRFYTSASQYTANVMGRGWSHGFDMGVAVNSDGHLAMGEQFAAQGAASIAELFVCVDLFSDTARPIEKIVTASLSDAWWIERLVNNTVIVSLPFDRGVFVKQPDGSFLAPARNPGSLTVAAGLYTLTTPQKVKYNFNAAGKVSTVVYPNGVTVTFTYTSGILTSVSNGMGRTLTLNYTSGRITSVTDGNGRSVSFGYDANNNLTTFTDALSKVTSYVYDQPGRMTQYFLPANPLQAFATNVYDSLSRVKTQANGRNQVFSYYIAGSRSEEVDPLGNKKTWYYNNQGGVTRIIDSLGYETKNKFDGLNRMIETAFPEGNKVQRTYDLNNNVLTETAIAKSGSGLANIVQTWTYDSNWAKVKTWQDGRLNTTTYTYDSLTGNLLTVQKPVVGGLTPTITMTWNARGQMLTSTDETGIVTKFSYDTVTEKLTSSVLDYNAGAGHLNLTTGFAYNSVGDITGITDPRGFTTTLSYDNQRRLTQKTDPAPFSYVTKFAYDDNDNLLNMQRQTGTTPAWQTYSFTYSATNKKLTAVDPASKTTTWTYDGKDRLQTMTDAESRLWQYSYDAMDRPYQVTDPTNTVSETRTYKPNGPLASVKDARNNTTQFTYDGFDRADRTTYADATYEQNSSYDANGNVLTYRTRSGSNIVMTYDVLNRLSTKAPASQPTVTNTYDLAGRLVQASKPVVAGDPSSGALQFFFDTAGRFYKEQYPDGKIVLHELDANGNITKTTWPDGYYVTRVYDQLNRLTDIKLNGSATSAVQFAYNQLSQRTQMTFSNGATVVYAPQLNEDVTSITHNFVGSSAVFTYGYNNVHEPNSVAVSDSAFMWHPPTAASVAYGTADNVNKYPTVGGTSYSYSTNKNLTGDGVWTYAYDTENHLLTAAKTGVSASFVYDPKHRQSQKTVGTVKNRYIYADWQRIADYDGVSGSLQTRYVYGTSLDEPLIAITAGGAVTFLHADKMGSIVAVSNSSGAVINKNQIGPFGEIGTFGGTTFGFTGQRYDADLDLHYYKRRYYSHKLGRFLQPDPWRLAGGDLNLYTYARNSSLRFTDPMGTNPLAALLGLFTGVGEAMGYTGVTATVYGAALTSAAVAMAALFIKQILGLYHDWFDYDALQGCESAIPGYKLVWSWGQNYAPGSWVPAEETDNPYAGRQVPSPEQQWYDGHWTLIKV